MIKIKELRVLHRMTQKHLAQHIGVAAHNVGDWERGKGEPNSDMLVKIASVLCVSVDCLLGNEKVCVKNSTLDTFNTLSLEEQSLIKFYRSIGESAQTAILSIVEILYNQDNKSNGQNIR